MGSPAAAAAISVLALAGSAAAQDETRAFVAGSGKGHFQESGGPFHLRLGAHGEGSDATGHVTGSGDNFGDFRVEGPVTCVLVVGNQASVKYRFQHTAGSAAPPEGGGVQVYIEDNGNPTRGRPMDRVATEFPVPPPFFELTADVCTPPSIVPVWTPIESGNYVVSDGP